MESEQLRKENDTSGPQDELEYWKKRGAQFSQLLSHLEVCGDALHVQLVPRIFYCYIIFCRIKKFNIHCIAWPYPIRKSSEDGKKPIRKLHSATTKQEITQNSFRQWKLVVMHFIWTILSI